MMDGLDKLHPEKQIISSTETSWWYVMFPWITWEFAS